MTNEEAIEKIQRLADEGRLDEIPAVIKASGEGRDFGITPHETFLAAKVPGIVMTRLPAQAPGI